MSSLGRTGKRRWFAPEVVQTSAMDCGPAALKCLLEGFGIPISYGRLREACQTNVDGTSIDTLEEVANQLGVHAEQVMIPIDHIFLSDARILPAMVVVRNPDGNTHFVVIWRRCGAWVQVMDPATGRRWMRCRQFYKDLFRHECPVPKIDWRTWAATDEFLRPLRQRLSALGADKNSANVFIKQALKDDSWLGIATLDAAIRLVQSIQDAQGVKSGRQALKLLHGLIKSIDGEALYQAIPLAYWSVAPAPSEFDDDDYIVLKGPVLLQIKAKSSVAIQDQEESVPLPPELEAALSEKPLHPIKALLTFLKEDGVLSPLVLCGVLTIAVAAVLIETLLFRGLFDVAWQLKLAEQRLGAVIGLLAFVGLLLLIEVPVAMESQRFGRHLETRLRMALLRKLPQLADRYFQSRPVSDMAERSHSIALARLVPGLAVQFVQTLWDIIFTLAGIMLIDPASSALAIVVTLLAIVLPLLAQPVLNEKDLRVHSHSGALFSFYLDALLGLVPIRTHRAELAVRREHEGLLVEWARSSRSLIQLSLLAEGVQSLLCMGVVGYMVFQHFVRSGGVTGADLLLVYWALKLPAIGQHLTALAHQYPVQRSILLRLLEPLAAPEENQAAVVDSVDNSDMAESKHPVSVEINDGSVVAAGHSILRAINVTIAAGEHVAIVGSSGAGKSSFVGLLLGWHRLSEGELLVDGHILSGARQQALRRQIAWVDPAVQLWNRSFLDNLTYAADDSHFEHMAGAIDMARLRGVLQKLPLGLQTYLGEGGTLVSGGEGQRIRLGRALLQTGVRLALLDEPFRGMDRDQRQQLLKEVRQWWAHATLLCVTHDVEETLSFERVLVVEGGQIIEDGNPNELSMMESRYRELLLAEKQVREHLWQNEGWRRIQVQNGLVKEMSTGHGHD